MADFRIEDHGSICLIRPLNDAAKAWLVENVQLEPWQWLGGAVVAAEPRFIDDIATGMVLEGLRVECH